MPTGPLADGGALAVGAELTALDGPGALAVGAGGAVAVGLAVDAVAVAMPEDAGAVDEVEDAPVLQAVKQSRDSAWRMVVGFTGRRATYHAAQPGVASQRQPALETRPSALTTRARASSQRGSAGPASRHTYSDERRIEPSALHASSQREAAVPVSSCEGVAEGWDGGMGGSDRPRG